MAATESAAHTSGILMEVSFDLSALGKSMFEGPVGYPYRSQPMECRHLLRTRSLHQSRCHRLTCDAWSASSVSLVWAVSWVHWCRLPHGVPKQGLSGIGTALPEEPRFVRLGGRKSV